MPQRRAVGDYNINAGRNLFPRLSARFTPRQVKSPIKKLRLPRRTVHPNACHANFFINKVMKSILISHHLTSQRIIQPATAVMKTLPAALVIGLI